MALESNAGYAFAILMVSEACRGEGVNCRIVRWENGSKGCWAKNLVSEQCCRLLLHKAIVQTGASTVNKNSERSFDNSFPFDQRPINTPSIKRH